MRSEFTAVFLDTGEYFWARMETSLYRLFAFHINHVVSKSRRSSKREVVHAISLIVFRAIWNVEKTLQTVAKPARFLSRNCKF